MADVQPLRDPEGAEKAYERVKQELEALDAATLSPMNVDVVSATSIALAVAPRLLPYRERMLVLPEFQIRSLDHLIDYAQAAWFVYVTNLPAPEPADATAMIQAVTDLRSKLLTWAAPLVAEGKFDAAAVAKIREGSGNKDIPSDVVALVALYRANWDAVKNMCAVTEEDLQRGADLAPKVFVLISLRENPELGRTSDASLRVRRAWTLLDRAYEQCRRALQFLRHDEDDADVIAPSLRRNSGVRRSTPEQDATTAAAPAPAPAPAPASVAAGSNGPSLGGSAAPFLKQ